MEQREEKVEKEVVGHGGSVWLVGSVHKAGCAGVCAVTNVSLRLFIV